MSSKPFNYPYSPFNPFNDSAIFNNAIFNASEAWAGFENFQVLSRQRQIPIEQRIINFLISSGNSGKNRHQIAQFTNAARTTVFDALQRMSLSDDIESDFRHVNGKKGRPSTLWFAKKVQQGNRR